MATARLTDAMTEYVDRPEPVMSCGCGAAMAPADMRRIPPGPGNAAVVRIGCPSCQAAAAATGLTVMAATS